MRLLRFAIALAIGLTLAPILAIGDEAGVAPDSDAAAPSENFSLHGQSTFVDQYHPPFTSPLRGANSLDPGHRGDETIDVTAFAGIRVWGGLEAYADAEVDQGFGLSNTLGLAGFSSGEAYKVGASDPYIRLPRAFLRYTVGLGGDEQKVEADANQLAGAHQADNVIVTLGKFSVTDIFDANSYAHDPRGDFLNWSIIDSGAFDYAADAWGYSYGGAIEWTQSWWTLRAGGFDLSRVPNSERLDRGFEQFQLIAEAEERHSLMDQPGKVKILFFLSRGRFADYNDATRLGQETATVPDVSLVRQFRSRPGAALNMEQQIEDDLGAFLRTSINDGHVEADEFTEINQSLAVGLSLKGSRWDRDDDTVGFAGVINGISKDASNYFAAGGLGILIGDGQLPSSNPEKIIEIYYRAAVVDGVAATFDYQRVENPGYDAVRGPVDIVGVRLHAEF